ncbi:MAG: 3-methyl-2-oxobutanoate hydroxymethyltransferase [Alphaproteobacteria bacterium]|jgi:3-methyl-2-oxobutanoate hydroxymethyltransferase|nr:3-methyl-2-oxobutanoate hydroxymethyltransferase [Pelagibacterales bacterium]RUA13610.1 MAG: 3-methyl-2-oxobutanoate hydroxymethyltransferase [Alphaproteobacteria bacterium]|tara:strand:+ start:1678 stop:2460 length:783 start_codon:yes stop_codon:yes gene_type:complete
MQGITIKNILEKKGKEPITCLTAYSKPMAEIIDKYCDIILVGDSVGMVLYGMKTTREVKIETLILHGKAVKNSAKRSFVVFDMPHKTYSNKFIAYKNVKKVMKSTKCDAVKLEGGRKIVNIIKYLTKKGIPVMGHIGLLPQSSKVFKLKGKNLIQKKQILQDAMALSNSGVFAIVIECVVESLAKKITDSVSVPTIGIGASKYCDGQILVTDDMIGLSNFRPRFVKKYSNVKKIIEKSVKNYCSDIKRRKFPSSQNVYRF